MKKLRNMLLMVAILLLTSCSSAEKGKQAMDSVTIQAQILQPVITESALKHTLSEKISSPVCAFFYIEGSASEDACAFAFTGELSGTAFDGALWYVNTQDCILLKDNIETIQFEPVMIENGQHLLFQINSTLPGDSYSYIWAVTEQKPQLLFETSGFCFMDNGLLAMVKTSVSSSAGGRIWQRYYLYWDQDKQSYETYMGRELTKDEFLSYENAWEARDQVESVLKEVIEQNYLIDDRGYSFDTTYEYIQCDSGIIYVNYVMSYHSDIYYYYAIMREKEGTVFLEEREHYDRYEKGYMLENDDFHIMDNWAGSYSHFGRTLENGYVDLNMIIYSENGTYSGYLNLDGVEKAEDEGAYSVVQDRLLVDITDNKDEINIYFRERIVEEINRGQMFGHYQNGDLLFSLKNDRDGMITIWQNMQFDEQETDLKRGLLKRDQIFALKLLNENDKQQFWKATKFPMTSQPFYQYFNDEDSLQLELYYDMNWHAGIGIFYDRYQGQVTMKPFDVGSWVAEDWSDDKFSLTTGDGNEYHFDHYNEEYIYNEQGQLTYFCSTGIVPGWKEPIMGKLVEIEFTYREDGTLQRKNSSFNSRAFSSNHGGTFYYDEQERLKYSTGYVTHGYLEYYYNKFSELDKSNSNAN